MSDSKKILVAEDNVVLGDVLRFNLQRSGYAVTLVLNGHEALRLLTSQHFDVLVTDFEMPGIDGEKLCAYARYDLKLDSLRIIMCSAKGMELDRELLREKYCLESILFKPFSIRELTILIDGLFLDATDNAPKLVTN
jgi:CheY-like chemotaxis protein